MVYPLSVSETTDPFKIFILLYNSRRSPCFIPHKTKNRGFLFYSPREKNYLFAVLFP